MKHNSYMASRRNPLALGLISPVQEQFDHSAIEASAIAKAQERARRDAKSLEAALSQVKKREHFRDSTYPMVGAGVGFVALATGAYYGYSKYSVVGAIGMGLFNLTVAGAAVLLGKEIGQNKELLRMQRNNTNRLEAPRHPTARISG
jgi:hypothetical protein